jgi:hypothetical protein
MSHASFKEGKISQRERLSLVAELLLEGALRIIKSQKNKSEIKNHQKLKTNYPELNDSRMKISQNRI